MNNRYFYYIVLQSMVLNVIIFVPHALIRERFEGGPAAILLAVPIGLALMITFMKALQKIPGKTVPELLLAALPKWVAWPIILYFSCLWFLAGALTLTTYTEITNSYIMPDTPTWSILFLFALLVVYVARKKSQSVLLGLEVFFVFNVPLVALLVFKSFLSDDFNWWAVRDIGTHVMNMPSISSIASATFVFSGYNNMAIFHSVTETKLSGFKHYALIGFFGLSTLTTSFLIPIGYHGTTAVAHYVFPWIATADSMSLEYFVIERVLFIFLLLYLSIILISSIVHWHVGSEVAGKVLTFKWTKEVVLAMFVAAVFTLHHFLRNQFDMSQFAESWLVLRLFSEIAFVGIVAFSVRRVQNRT